MALWSRSALAAYLIAAFGIVAFDHLWSFAVPSVSDLASSGSAGFLEEDRIATVRRWSRLFPWMEMAVLVVIFFAALRLNPPGVQAFGAPFLVLVALAITGGRELFGLRVAFTAPFGLKLAGACLFALLAILARGRLKRRS